LSPGEQRGNRTTKSQKWKETSEGKYVQTQKKNDSQTKGKGGFNPETGPRKVGG